MGKSKLVNVTTLTLTLAILASPFILPQSQIQQAQAAVVSIRLVGFFDAWNLTSPIPNPRINATGGDAVSIALSSGDRLLHRFFVDVDRTGDVPTCPPDKCSAVFPPDTTYTFMVDFAAGTYVYYCSVHPLTMAGIFEVRAPPIVGGDLIPMDKLSLLAPYIGIASAIMAGTAVLIYIGRKKKGREN